MQYNVLQHSIQDVCCLPLIIHHPTKHPFQLAVNEILHRRSGVALMWLALRMCHTSLNMDGLDHTTGPVPSLRSNFGRQTRFLISNPSLNEAHTTNAVNM